MYTNADQFTTIKKSELLEVAERKKPHTVVIYQVKPKSLSERTELGNVIPGFYLHILNLDPNIGRDIVIYNEIPPDFKFSEICSLKIRLCEGNNLLFGCFYRRPTPTSRLEENNDSLNNLLY